MNLLISLYAINIKLLRRMIRDFVTHYEGGEIYSKSLRAIMKRYHGVTIGMYTHGGCFDVGYFDRCTTIGRYCSIARCVRVLNVNHPMDHKSTHGFFFNPELKYVRKYTAQVMPLTIGNDVWIGHNAIILPHVRQIGDGAVIGAGSVVNKDIPAYGIAVGNPARLVRYRFMKETIEKLVASRWWERSIEELMPEINQFIGPYEAEKASDGICTSVPVEQEVY